MSVLTLKLTAVQALALGCVGVVVGSQLKRRLRVLDDLNIPGPILGGLLYAIAVLALRGRALNVDFDMSLRDVLMVAFFTTLGMSASLRLIRIGGVQVLWFLLIATVGAVLQNALGVGLAKAFGLEPLLGVVSGSVALTGGPATALAFGKTFEDLGVAGASTLGVASAMFGITAGGLLGGFLGGRLIRRKGLRGEARPAAVTAPAALTGPELIAVAPPPPGAGEASVLRSLTAVAVAMAVGSVLQPWLEQVGVKLPAYVGAMVVGAVLRNLDDHFGWFGLEESVFESLGNVALSIFIVMALTTLKLWELSHLAVPMLAILGAQLLLVCAMCLAVFWAMGKDYEAAVMSGGFCGFMLGTTANAMACMGELVSKHGPAPRAFIVVPLVGAFLIDFTNASIVTAALNLFR